MKKNTNAILAFISIILIWQIYTLYLTNKGLPIKQFIPSPKEVFTSGTKLVFEKRFWDAMFFSNFRVLTAFSISIILGTFFGIIIGWWNKISNFISPSVNFGRYLPVAALVPLSIILFGVSDIQKIIVLIFGTVFHVIVLVEDAIRRISKDHLDIALTLGVKKKKLIYKVVIPSILPDVFDASRVSMGLCWSYLLVAEIVASEKGIGYQIIRSQRFLQISDLYFLIIVLGFLGLFYDRIFVLLKPVLFPWKKKFADES